MQPTQQMQMAGAQRQTNFLILRSLEAQLDPETFQQVLDTVSMPWHAPRLGSEQIEPASAGALGRPTHSYRLLKAQAERR